MRIWSWCVSDTPHNSDSSVRLCRDKGTISWCAAHWVKFQSVCTSAFSDAMRCVLVSALCIGTVACRSHHITIPDRTITLTVITLPHYYTYSYQLTALLHLQWSTDRTIALSYQLTALLHLVINWPHYYTDSYQLTALLHLELSTDSPELASSHKVLRTIQVTYLTNVQYNSVTGLAT